MFWILDDSEDRSGSSLASEEKDEKRKQYLNKGINNFDKDIRNFLNSVDKENLYDQFSSATPLSGSIVVLVAGVAALLS